ncbi:antibiotic biosynthesis monooxygenase family protein [Salaquimonas pukyongi]|uniref:antibiotic biosynthesis monooxygenase family protein n=1 Tax=Salaquimonas pukyongi TaxID=2712698 RepID=UPI00096B7A64|nr:antibiotic biosynthesis monooxygenase [Salaquimonas pukyongi]
MPVTIFRSRLRSENSEKYYQWSERMNELAKAMPGYVSHKGFTAPDGERVTIVEFSDFESQKAWAQHPEHREAMKLGRAEFYEDYEIIVCDVVRRSAKKK